MAGKKIQKFLGIAPKVSDELLPAMAAQNAVNLKLYSGDLIPYHAPLNIGNVGRSGEIKTVYPLIDSSDSSNKWLSWTTDVDVAIASSTNDDEQRIYYTGDGVPKVTNYEIAVTGSGPYPVAAYDLGLPLPTTTPTTTAASISAVTIASVNRNSEGITTVKTDGNHSLDSGDYVTITGFTSVEGEYSSSDSADTITFTPDEAVIADVGSEVYVAIESGPAVSGYFVVSSTTATTFTVDSPGVSSGSGNASVNARGYNVVSAPIIKIDADEFEVYTSGITADSSGLTLAEFETAFSGGTSDIIQVKLAGTEIARSYVYTWMTPWGEESIPSEASDDVYVVEGQNVTVSGLPTAAPSGDNFISGFRLYRSVTSTTGSTYFLLRTVWFPITSTFAERTSNTVTITFGSHHNLAVDDLFKISGVAFGGTPDATFDVTDGVVLSVTDDYTFTYTAAGSDKVSTATTAGTMYFDTAEYDSGDSTYYEASSFVDNYNVDNLTIALDSEYADAPDDDMTGLKSVQNNMLAGFFGNVLCISDPDRPWSWPIKYRLTFPYDIVAIEPMGGAIVVMTEKYPFIVQGDRPSNMAYSRADVIMPCVSKRGVANIGYGVLYPSHAGLAIYSPQTGADVVTKLLHHWDTWDAALDPSTIVAEFFDGMYFASHTGGSFIYERDDQTGGNLTTTPYKFYAAHYDALNNLFYYIADLNGQLTQWDDPDGLLLSAEWKSKAFVSTEYSSIGAMRVVADYEDITDENTAIVAFNLAVPTTNAAWWALMAQLGTVNGAVDYTDPDTATYTPVYSGLNSFPINGDPVSVYELSTIGVSLVTVKVWANKTLQHTVIVQSSDIFRLPSGYKADTFEVSVSGAVRIRAIHMAETPAGLRSV